MFGGHSGPDVTVLAQPRDDALFRGVVEELRPRADDAASRERDLRRYYPRATVRAQDHLATLGGTRTWYAYRDGHFRSEQSEPWWETADAGIGRVEIDGDANCTQCDEAAARLLGTETASIVGSRLPLAATCPETCEGRWMVGLLERHGYLHSTTVSPLDHGEILEFRAIRDGAGQGRHLVLLRHFPDGETSAAS